MSVRLAHYQHLRRKGTVDVFFVVGRVHESRFTSSQGDPQLGKFVLSRQVNLNTPGCLKPCWLFVLCQYSQFVNRAVKKKLPKF